jgi:hypothetical protein
LVITAGVSDEGPFNIKTGASTSDSGEDRITSRR